MAIAPSTWAFREGLPSSKHSRQTLEQTWPGRVIIAWQGCTDAAEVSTYFGWYRYNPAKQIHNRMRVEFSGVFVGPGNLQYSLDDGVTWTNLATSSATIPAGVLVTFGDSAAGSVTQQLEIADVDLSGIVTTRWIGLRHVPFVAATNSYYCKAMLYNATYNPF